MILFQFRVFLLVVGVLLCASHSHAQWSTDPYNNLIVGYGLLPELCSDSAGGCYITYEDNTTYPRHLILHRLDRYGYKPWGNSGKQLTGLLPQQFSAKLCEDGQHGVIVSYVDLYTNNSETNPVFSYRVRVQRVDSSGNFLWGSEGVRVSVSETNQSDQAVVTDGDGGCFVAYKDTQNTLRVQRISFDGTRAWGDSGKLVAYTQDKPILAFSSTVGFIINYAASGFYAQRVNLDGEFLWGSGIRIPTGARIIKADQAYLYFLGGQWLGYRNQQLLFTIAVQKVDTSGTLLWDSLGVAVDTRSTPTITL